MEKMSAGALALVANRFKLLSSPTRLAILQCICIRERTVTDLVCCTGQKQSNVSRQLGLLRQAGLVTRRVEGTNAFYGIADETLPKLCELMHESLKARHDEMAASLA